jgi:DNA-binding NarL/FixJ family response regulator
MKILLVDDHIIVRDGIKLVIQSDPSLELVGEAGNGAEAVTKCNDLEPDVIIMDIDMPVMNGIDAVKEIRKTNKNVKIIILTMYEKESFLLDGISSGINGYLYKMASMDELLQAIHSVYSGMEIYSPKITQILSAHLNKRSNDLISDDNKEVFLSSREKEIVIKIAGGMSNKQIAEDLFLSIFTVKNHRKNIMHKLGFKKVNELVRYAMEKGYVN